MSEQDQNFNQNEAQCTYPMMQDQAEMPLDQQMNFGEVKEEDFFIDEVYDCENIINMELVRAPSIRNKQYELVELTQQILQQAERINGQTGMGFDWSILLYGACGWKRQPYEKLLLSVNEQTKISNESHKKFINFTNKYIGCQGKSREGDCEICGEQAQPLLTNLCGHQFCKQCWRNQLSSRLQTDFNFPFPPCMQQQCPIKMSYTLCKQLCTSDPALKSKFIETLCRGYAKYSRKIKMCKGRPGFNCNRCFKIDKMFDIIECDSCGNFMCPRCDERYHGSTECYEISIFKRLTEDSTEFVEMLNYKLCPNCGDAVERNQGCNSMICKCKQEFCFVCGEKWLPNHTAHGDSTCYRYKQIQTLNEQKKKRKQNKQEYFEKMQERKSKLDSIYHQFDRIEKLKNSGELQNIKSTLKKHFNLVDSMVRSLDEYCRFLQKCLCVLWGNLLSLHFKQNKVQQMYCEILQKNIEKISNFLFEFTEKMYCALNKQNHLRTKKELQLITQDNKNSFRDQFIFKTKQTDSFLTSVEKIVNTLDTITNA